MKNLLAGALGFLLMLAPACSEKEGGQTGAPPTPAAERGTEAPNPPKQREAEFSVDRASPQKLAVSLIKAYDRGGEVPINQLLDQYFAVLESRNHRCTAELIRQVQCVNRAGDDIFRQGPCFAETFKCLCAKPDADPRPLATSWEHADGVLRGIPLRIRNCQIRSVRMRIGKDTGQSFCGDAEENQELAEVLLGCDNVTGPIRVLLIERADGWRILEVGGEGFNRSGLEQAMKTSLRQLQQHDAEVDSTGAASNKP